MALQATQIVQAGSIEERYVEAIVLSALVFLLQGGQMSLFAGEIQGVAADERALVAEFRCQLFNLGDRLQTTAIGMYGLRLTNLLNQFDQPHVDFVQEQAGAGSSATGSYRALVDENRIDARTNQHVADECPRDAGTNDDNFARHAAIQRITGHRIRAGRLPKRVARPDTGLYHLGFPVLSPRSSRTDLLLKRLQPAI